MDSYKRIGLQEIKLQNKTNRQNALTDPISTKMPTEQELEQSRLLIEYLKYVTTWPDTAVDLVFLV